MKDLIVIEFTQDEVKEILVDYYGLADDGDYNADDYTNDEIHWAIVNR